MGDLNRSIFHLTQDRNGLRRGHYSSLYAFISFKLSTSTDKNLNITLDQVENADFSDIGAIGDFFSNFLKAVFSLFTYSQYEKLGFQRILDFQTSVFSIFKNYQESESQTSILPMICLRKFYF